MILPNDPSGAQLLTRALLANALFSAICGLLIVVFDARIAGVIAGAGYSLWPLGVLLLGFSASLAWFATRPAIHSAWVTSVIIADLAWVAGTVILLAGWHALLTAAGIWILALVGVVVFAFAELQWLGLRRLRSSAHNA